MNFPSNNSLIDAFLANSCVLLMLLRLWVYLDLGFTIVRPLYTLTPHNGPVFCAEGRAPVRFSISIFLFHLPFVVLMMLVYRRGSFNQNFMLFIWFGIQSKTSWTLSQCVYSLWVYYNMLSLLTYVKKKHFFGSQNISPGETTPLFISNILWQQVKNSKPTSIISLRDEPLVQWNQETPPVALTNGSYYCHTCICFMVLFLILSNKFFSFLVFSFFFFNSTPCFRFCYCTVIGYRESMNRIKQCLLSTSFDYTRW